MKNKKPILLLIVSILSFLMTLAAFVFFVKIIFNKNIHISAVQSTLENRMIEKENFSALEDKVKEIENTHKKINSFFLKKSQADLFVDYLENLGTDSNTKLSVKSVESSTKDKDFIVFKIFVEGNFSDIMQTISLLENAPYNILVDSLYINREIVPVSTDPNAPKITNNIQLWNADVSFSILSIK